MGWIETTVGSYPNTVTIKFFSIAQEVSSLKEGFLNFIGALAPGYWVFIIFVVCMTMAVLFVYSVYVYIKTLDVRNPEDVRNANERH